MTIEFSCSACAFRMQAPDTAAGQSGPCPQCGVTVTVPPPAPPAPAMFVPATLSPASSGPASSPPYASGPPRAPAGPTTIPPYGGAPILPPLDKPGASKARGVGCFWPALGAVLVMMLAVGVPFYLLYQAQRFGGARKAEERAKLERIGLALSQYHDKHGSYPPAVVYDAQGTPLYSWRVLILPELGYQDAYDQFKKDEPWNSSANIFFTQSIPEEYSVDFGVVVPHGQTGVLAFVGPDAALDEKRGRKRDEITDPADDTALLATCSSSGLFWTQPGDFKPPDHGLATGRPAVGDRSGTVTVLFVDGSADHAKPSPSQVTRAAGD